MLFLIKSVPLQTVVMAIQIGEKILYVLSVLLTLVTSDGPGPEIMDSGRPGLDLSPSMNAESWAMTVLDHSS